MNRKSPALLAVLMALFAPASLCAEVQVAWNRNQDGDATREFRFKDVPAPSRTDAGNRAQVTIVQGRRDPNGGTVSVLCDGRLPRDEDQPGANFFFAAGTAGGRLLLDLTEISDVRSVRTYSWHRDTRGPQVYKLYASDGAKDGFDPKTAGRDDLEKAGWRLLAAVDTRPEEGAPGGQYGVRISSSDGKGLGKLRYLLLDVTRTEAEDPFGNTFLSEIDVDDGKEYPAPEAPAPVTIVAKGEYEMTFDVTESPELKEWVETKLKPVCVEWYPKIVSMLPSDGYEAPKRFTVTFLRDMSGVAATSGTRVVCGVGWFSRNLEGEAIGAVVHELVHVVQQYRRVRGGNRNPGWLVEGVADYIRWFLYEPASLRPRPDPRRAHYTDSYRTTGAFLDYVMENASKEVVRKLNAAMREGKYSPDLWKSITGKTVDDLWADYVKTLERR